MDKVAVYIHGKGGNANEAEHYRPLLEEYDIIGFDYKALTPWEAKEEFTSFITPFCKTYKSVTVIANSIGAYFSMFAFSDKKIDKAFLISPIVNMEKLITDMMAFADITEDDLRRRGEIPTISGEKLSWEYLEYVREHPLVWNVPTYILYGEKDELTPFETISDFSKKIGGTLTVMENGEHWFHTAEQMKFLDSWIKEYL